MSIMTLESHIFNDSEDSITFKLQSLDNYKPSIEDGISTKRFNNKITYQRNKNTQTQEMHNSFETSKTLLVKH